MIKTRIAAVVAAALLPAAAVLAQTTAPPKPAPPATKPAPAAPAAAGAPAAAATPAAPAGKTLDPQATFDLLLRERMAQGQPDSPELRAAVRDELNTRELRCARRARRTCRTTPT
jgi:peptidyl-prolyl cis-trans isomerase C